MNNIRDRIVVTNGTYGSKHWIVIEIDGVPVAPSIPCAAEGIPGEMLSRIVGNIAAAYDRGFREGQIATQNQVKDALGFK